MDPVLVHGQMRELVRQTQHLGGVYERLSRYVVAPITRDDAARRDDLVLEIRELEERRAALVSELLAAVVSG